MTYTIRLVDWGVGYPDVGCDGVHTRVLGERK